MFLATQEVLDLKVPLMNVNFCPHSMFVNWLNSGLSSCMFIVHALLMCAIELHNH